MSRTLTAILVTALLIAGCGGEAGEGTTVPATTVPVTTSPPTTAAATTTTVTPTPTEVTTTGATTTTSEFGSPVVNGQTLLVAGREECDFDHMEQGTWTTDPDGTAHVRDAGYDCTDTSNDPRVAGSAHYTWNAERWGTSEANGAMVQWGTGRIENDGGAWEGQYLGIYTSHTGDVLTYLFAGSGGYEGLAYYMWDNGSFGADIAVQGMIFSGAAAPFSDPWTPDSAEVTTTTGASTTTSAGTGPVAYGPALLVAGQEECDWEHMEGGAETTDADGTIHLRHAWFTCEVANNDPRLAGTSLYTWNHDRWGTSEANGAMVQWGTVRIENDGGAWEGQYLGIYTSETGDLVATLYTGTGDYAGLSCYQFAFNTYEATWPTQGLIFPGTLPIP